MTGCVLLTGGTGFVGMETLARLLESSDREVIALVRADDDDGARERMDGVLARIGREDLAGRVHPVAGDVTSSGLGLSEARREDVAGRIGAVVHCAASVSFALGLEESRAINVEGTRRVVELARRAPGLERFVHVSTAYVAGAHPGAFAEDDFDRGQSFRNPYEQSKWEAEALVRDAGLPATVVRPSIIVGDSETGWTASFNVLYHPLRAFSRGGVDSIPADPDSVLDVVPVDYVAAGILAALEAPDPPATITLAAGERAARLEDVIHAAAEYFDRPRPGLDGEPPEGLDAFLPYMTVETRFGCENARALGLAPPRLADYFDRLMDFAVDARWGKRQAVPRPQPAATARTSPAA